MLTGLLVYVYVPVFPAAVFALYFLQAFFCFSTVLHNYDFSKQRLPVPLYTANRASAGMFGVVDDDHMVSSLGKFEIPLAILCSPLS